MVGFEFNNAVSQKYGWNKLDWGFFFETISLFLSIWF